MEIGPPGSSSRIPVSFKRLALGSVAHVVAQAPRVEETPVCSRLACVLGVVAFVGLGSALLSWWPHVHVDGLVTSPHVGPPMPPISLSSNSSLSGNPSSSVSPSGTPSSSSSPSPIVRDQNEPREAYLHAMRSRWDGVSGEHPLCNASILQDEFAAASAAQEVTASPPVSLSRARGAVVTIVGHYDRIDTTGASCPRRNTGFLHDIRNFAAANDEFFFAPFKLDWVLLYQDARGFSCAFIGLAAELGWRRGNSSRGGNGRSADDGADSESDLSGDFFTPLGTRVLVRPRSFALPRFVVADPTNLQHHAPHACNFGASSTDYRLYSGAAYSFHAPLDDIFSSYDVVIKLDTDVEFHARPPLNPVSEIISRGCVFAHTYIEQNDPCSGGALSALQRFTRSAGTGPPASADYAWCIKPHVFNGNFVGWRSSFLRSPVQAVLATWLYECNDGYWRERWTDQVAWTLYVCLQHSIPDLRNSTAGAAVCDFSAWRADSVFVHH